MNREKSVLTAKMVAKKFLVCSETIIGLAKKGKIPCKKVGNFFLFDKDVFVHIFPGYNDNMVFITEKEAIKLSKLSKNILRKMASEGKINRIHIATSVRYIKNEIKNISNDKAYLENEPAKQNNGRKNAIPEDNKKEKQMINHVHVLQRDGKSNKDVLFVINNLQSLALGKDAINTISELNNSMEYIEEIVEFLSEIEHSHIKDKSYYNDENDLDSIAFYRNVLVGILLKLKHFKPLIEAIRNLEKELVQ